MPVTPADYVAAIDAALAICEARLAACDAAWTDPEGGVARLAGAMPTIAYADLNQHHDGEDIRAAWSHYYGPGGDFQTHRVECPILYGRRQDVEFYIAARTDLPASLRRDIAGLQAHRDLEAELQRFTGTAAGGIILRACAEHRAYSQRIFADCGVKVGGGE